VECDDSMNTEYWYVECRRVECGRIMNPCEDATFTVIVIPVWNYGVNGTQSHNYRVSLAIWDHTVLPAIRHK